MQALRPSLGGNAGNPQNPGNAQQRVVPFVVGSTEGVQLGTTPLGFNQTGAQQIFQNLEVPPTGFHRGLWAIVTATTTGNIAATTFAPDGPFAAVANVRFMDISSNPLFGDMAGYEWYLTNLLGGYWPVQDPTQSRLYSAVVGTGGNGGSFKFALWIPAEIVGREAFGSLENMAANSTFRFNLTAEASAAVYSVAPTTLPAITIQFVPEMWNKPSASYMGDPVLPTPPRNDTTQYWSRNQYTWSGTGTQQVKLQRVGFSLRNLVLLFRTTANVRLTDVQMPPTLEFAIDNKTVRLATMDWWINNTSQRAQLSPTGLPSGVVGLSFCHDENMRQGNEIKTLYLPTAEASLLQFKFTPTVAGSLTVLTNDLAITQGA